MKRVRLSFDAIVMENITNRTLGVMGVPHAQRKKHPTSEKSQKMSDTSHIIEIPIAIGHPTNIGP